jgi:hypothetical protein
LNPDNWKQKLLAQLPEVALSDWQVEVNGFAGGTFTTLSPIAELKVSVLLDPYNPAYAWNNLPTLYDELLEFEMVVRGGAANNLSPLGIVGFDYERKYKRVSQWRVLSDIAAFQNGTKDWYGLALIPYVGATSDVANCTWAEHRFGTYETGVVDESTWLWPNNGWFHFWDWLP